MDKDEEEAARLPIGQPILAEQLLAQPRTVNIPALTDGTTQIIIKHKANLKVKKKKLTDQVNEARDIKRKLVKKLAEGEWSLSCYEAEANVLILKGKALKINSLLDVLDENISNYEVVPEECRMQHEQTED